MGTKVKAIREAASILAMLLELKRTEEGLWVYFIDTLANEYNWSIEYIQNLTLEEVAGFVNHIKIRKDTEDIRNQINNAKGFSGKISSNLSNSKKPSKKTEYNNLKKLSRGLGVPLKEVKDQEKDT